MPSVSASSGSVSGWDQVSKLEGELSAIVQAVSGGQRPDSLSPGTAEAISQAIVEARAGAPVSLAAVLTATPVARPADADRVEAAIGTGYQVLQYLDVHIDVTKSGTPIGGITRTGQALEMSVTLAEDLSGRLVYAVRYHDGTVTSLPTTVSGNTVRFSSDRFSTFAIVAAPRQAQDVSFGPIPDQPYTGQPVTPSFSVTVGGQALTENADYTVSFTNNIEPGTATAHIDGINGYVGLAAGVSFNILSPSPTPAPTAAPTAAPTPAPTAAPTGDGTPLAFYGTMLALSAGALALVLTRRKTR